MIFDRPSSHQLMVGFSFRVTRAQGMREWLPTVEYDWSSNLQSTAQKRTSGTNRAHRRRISISPFKVCFASVPHLPRKCFFLSEFINGALTASVPFARLARINEENYGSTQIHGLSFLSFHSHSSTIHSTHNIGAMDRQVM